MPPGPSAPAAAASSAGGAARANDRLDFTSYLTPPEPECVPEGYAALNSPPLFMRLSVNAFPETQALMKKSALTFGGVVHPFAIPPPGARPVSLVPTGRAGIVRCKRCRTYMNPFVAWLEAGRKWRCNICHMVNDVPDAYRSPLDEHGRRADTYERPELCEGTVDYLASKDYAQRPPQPPVFVFVVDVSVSAVSSGVLATVAAAVTAALDSLCADERSLFALITVDASVHFYALGGERASPCMLAVADVADIELPLPAHALLVNTQDARANIARVLGALPGMFKDTTVAGNALGAALQAAFKLASHRGGKVVVVQSTAPDVGPGAFAVRDGRTAIGKAEESRLLQPATDFYKLLAVDSAPLHLCYDLLVVSQKPTDMATLSSLPRYTSGSVFFYPGFQAPRDGARLHSDLLGLLTKPVGWEAVMRVRCSKGVSVTGFHGHYFMRSSDLLSLPNIDTEKAYTFTLTMEDSVAAQKSVFPYVCFQAALLYTSSEGQRCIRVHTVAAPITTDVAVLYRSVDVPAFATVLCRLGCERAEEASLDDARQAILNKCTEVTKAYRSAVSTAAGPAAAALTRQLPYLCLAMVKSPLFRVEGAGSIDSRCHALYTGRNAPVHLLMATLSPRLFAVLGGTEPAPGSVLPPTCILSASSLADDAVLLMDTGLAMWLWVGKAVAAGAMEDLFGPGARAGNGQALRVTARDTPLSQHMFGLMGAVREQRPNYMALFVIRQEDQHSALFLPHLIEDRSPSVMAYPEWLVHLSAQK